jgi:hypothetical protein
MPRFAAYSGRVARALGSSNEPWCERQPISWACYATFLRLTGTRKRSQVARGGHRRARSASTIGPRYPSNRAKIVGADTALRGSHDDGVKNGHASRRRRGRSLHGPVVLVHRPTGATCSRIRAPALAPRGRRAARAGTIRRIMSSGRTWRCARRLPRSGAPGAVGGRRRGWGPTPGPARGLPLGQVVAGLLDSMPGRSAFNEEIS